MLTFSVESDYRFSDTCIYFISLFRDVILMENLTIKIVLMLKGV